MSEVGYERQCLTDRKIAWSSEADVGDVEQPPRRHCASRSQPAAWRITPRARPTGGSEHRRSPARRTATSTR